ncbi:MAG: hypothetical protein ABF370_14700, partial [Verrucomicrobiales bacterium]
VYPVVLVDSPEMVPASGKVAAHVIVKGDTEGNRANLSIKNDFRLVLSDYCRYEEPDPEWGGYIDTSLFAEPSPSAVVSQEEGGQK